MLNTTVSSQLTGLSHTHFSQLGKIDFDTINEIANAFADHIENRLPDVCQILSEYETFEVIEDEISRTLDLLRNLDENRQYFQQYVGAVTSFLPKNQPLYALTCFVIVPSLMANEVHFRIPHSMKHFFGELLEILEAKRFFPNLMISKKERLQFLAERSALLLDEQTKESIPVTDVVIFTGTSHHAEQLRLVFDKRTLFISNGSGHNPVVIAEDAEIDTAVQAVCSLQFYNQGQDCAGPNAILVHSRIYYPFLCALRDELKNIHVGPYKEKSCRVGPITDIDDLIRIQSILVSNSRWLDSTTPGKIRTSDSIVEPTIICKPLEEGGNYQEVFAPIIFLQEYSEDKELSSYFDNTRYAKNAMYVTQFGNSNYINDLHNLKVDGKNLHDNSTILTNTHLHAKGVERGTQPYGGYGIHASSVSIGGKLIPKPTLPQRDIFEYVAKPLLDAKSKHLRVAMNTKEKKLVEKDVQKLLGLKTVVHSLKSNDANQIQYDSGYFIDTNDIKNSEHRFVKLEKEKMYQLLKIKNSEFIANLAIHEMGPIQKLRQYLLESDEVSIDEFKNHLYGLAKNPSLDDEANKKNQLVFFKNIYSLLFGKPFGPRLVPFLYEIKKDRIEHLLDI